jgi:hypothetical protein
MKYHLIDKIIQKTTQGYYIVTPRDYNLDEIQPISCPQCKKLFRTRDDEFSWQNHKCCNNCMVEKLSGKKQNYEQKINFHIDFPD